MRTTVFLFFALIFTSLSFAGTKDTVPADNHLIEYTGRIDFSDKKAPRFSYSGVSIRASFTGTGISALLDDNIGKNFYNIILDGQVLDTINVSMGKKLYKLAAGLANTRHEIEIFKRTEEMFGKTQFFGFVVENGTLAPIANQRPRLLEFIGNSITCGYGNEGKMGEKFGPTTENHYMTYAAITARNLNARDLAVCKSGIGIYRNYNGPATGNADCMPNYYTRIYLWDKEPEYSFSEKPDLICINLGTNDFSTTGGDSALYVSNYLRFINIIQSKYRQPEIVCLLGSMITEPTLTNIRGYLKTIVKLANQKGKGKVHFFEMSEETPPLGIDTHPTVAQHIKNATELTAYIKALKGW